MNAHFFEKAAFEYYIFFIGESDVQCYLERHYNLLMLSRLAGNNAHGDGDPALLQLPLDSHQYLHSSDQILVRYKKYLNFNTNSSKFILFIVVRIFRQLNNVAELHLLLGFSLV